MARSRDRLRVLVVDDEPLARRGMRELLAQEFEPLEVFEASDGVEAVLKIRTLAPDVVFLDVQMPGLSGIGVIEEVGAAKMPPVVFVSAYDKYALKAFDAQAIDYIVKPVDPDRFRDAFERACNARASAGIVALRSALESLIRLAKQLTESTASGATSATTPTASARLRVRHEGRVILIDPRDVDWIESTGNYVHLHVRGSRFRHRATVDEMHALLGDGFVRIRRSTMVRIGAVKYCEPYGKGTYAIVLYDQTRLLSSRYFRKELRSLLGR